MQHRKAAAAHPDALRGRGDLDRLPGQHCDRVAAAHTGGGQTARNPAGPLMHLTPGMPDRGVRLPSDHALETALGVVVHGLGESAHHNPPGSGATARRVLVESVLYRNRRSR
jgi:hypothetical protein